MGQSSSRQHRQPETPRNPPRNNETDDESHPANSSSPSALSSDPTVPPRAGPSRRASVRRSILNLVTPSARSRADSNTNNLRKSWLSRRLSKAPSDAYTSPQLTDTPETPVETTSAASERGKDVSRGPDPSSADSIAGPSLHPIVSPSPDFPDNLEEVTECVRKEIVGNDLGQSAEGIPQEINPSEDVQAEVPITPELMPNLVTAVEQSTAIDEAAPSDSPVNLEDAPSDPRPTAQHAQPPGRPFPPPGTLVVVQGVVHTTDVPRPNALSTIATEAASAPRSSSVPPNSSNDNTRNRLSTLLRSRPASATAPDPPSSSDTTSLSGISTSQDFTSSPNNPPAEPSQAHPAPRTEPHSLANVHPPPIPTSSDSQPGTISSSSIDVLGTLLSVAAAATAASLLTGTTEPMLPPNINPPSYSSDSTPVRSPGPNGYAPPLPDSWPRSTSPSPINDLGPGTDPAAAGRAERLRHAWGSIRERLGLRPTPSPATLASSPEMEPQVTPGLSSNDPRELVLAQMARAFNLGFGLGDSSTNPATREGGEPEASQPRENAAPETSRSEGALQLSPDGSFDRFLVDLQADLRAALTTSRPPSDNASTADPSPAEAREGSSRMNGQSPAPVVEGLAGDASDPASNYADIPDSEDNDATISAVSHPSRHSTSTDQAPGASEHDPTRAPPETRQATESPAADPRINWWRLYRFPPITTRTPGVAGRLPASSSSPPAFSATNNASRPESTTQLEEMDATLSELPFANSDLNQDEVPDTPNTVVPVIVVGLQSVNTAWPAPPNVEDNLGEPEPLGGQDEDGRSDHVTEGIPSTPASRTDGSEATGRRPPSRGRAWHSRAAEALRNLRPGRRNRTAPTQTAAGSRTFLIYVIGGYYPPDHSIVTGGPDTLDSFEALLELAELLGQVKPPTVTKEDIEKSGLEIIKAAQLQEYEKEHKISSNCIDRCLICLDDYGVEEDIRVMACRHAFHKGCVDKWLETGRNNCPACRSRGVPLNPSEVR